MPMQTLRSSGRASAARVCLKNAPNSTKTLLTWRSSARASPRAWISVNAIHRTHTSHQSAPTWLFQYYTHEYLWPHCLICLMSIYSYNTTGVWFNTCECANQFSQSHCRCPKLALSARTIIELPAHLGQDTNHSVDYNYSLCMCRTARIHRQRQPKWSNSQTPKPLKVCPLLTSRG